MDSFTLCRDRERKRRYRILLTVQLSCSSPHLTRIVTLLPNFIVTNHSRRPLRFMEDNERADLWIDLAPSQVFPFKVCQLFKGNGKNIVINTHVEIMSKSNEIISLHQGFSYNTFKTVTPPLK